MKLCFCSSFYILISKDIDKCRTSATFFTYAGTSFISTSSSMEMKMNSLLCKLFSSFTLRLHESLLDFSPTKEIFLMLLLCN